MATAGSRRRRSPHAASPASAPPPSNLPSSAVPPGTLTFPTSTVLRTDDRSRTASVDRQAVHTVCRPDTAMATAEGAVAVAAAVATTAVAAAAGTECALLPLQRPFLLQVRHSAPAPAPPPLSAIGAAIAGAAAIARVQQTLLLRADTSLPLPLPRNPSCRLHVGRIMHAECSGPSTGPIQRINTTSCAHAKTGRRPVLFCSNRCSRVGSARPCPLTTSPSAPRLDGLRGAAPGLRLRLPVQCPPSGNGTCRAGKGSRTNKATCGGPQQSTGKATVRSTPQRLGRQLAVQP